MPPATPPPLLERFDYGALSHIIEHFHEFHFRPETDVSATLQTLRRYMKAASPDGTIRVTYRRQAHNHGRLFAFKGLSMQNMAREVRNAIGFRVYHYLDFKNCHPELLLQFCQREGVGCPLLDEFISNRERVLCGLVSETPGAAKAAILAVINGGVAESPLRFLDMVSSPRAEWLRNFEAEMTAVRTAVLALPKGAPYLELARKSLDMKRKKAAVTKGGGNLSSSAMNHLLCDLENSVLMAMRHFLENERGRKVGVLVFDGCMVERIASEEDSSILEDVLNEASDHILQVTGYSLRIVAKNMAADKLDVPREAYTNWDFAGTVAPHADLVLGLRGLGGALGELRENLVFNKVKEGFKFAMAGDDGEALLYRDTTRIFTDDDDAAYLGAFCGKFTVPASLGHLHKDVPPDVVSYSCTVHERVMVFASEDDKVRVSLYNAQGGLPSDARIDLSVHGKAPTSVTSQVKIKSLLAVHAKYIEKELRRRLVDDSLSLFSFINTGTINNNYYTLDPDAGRHTDEQLINAVMAANPSLKERYRFPSDHVGSNCKGVYICNATTNIWAQRHNVVVERVLINAFAGMELADIDRRHVESRRGCNDMLHVFASNVADESFVERLDADFDLFAVNNGVFDLRVLGGGFRPIEPSDCIGITTGWSYDPESSSAHRAEVEAFLCGVLPIKEEREVVLVFFAHLLSGWRREKKLMLLTDRRDGNNGKSTLIKLVRRLFGSYSESSTKFVCRGGGFAPDRNSHDAGMEPLRGKRLLLSEELDDSMILDNAILKRVAGGEQEPITGRKCGSGEQFHFIWQAGIVLVFNDGKCPKFDVSDSAFLQRFIVVPMRSKFVANPESVDHDSHTFLMDPDLIGRFSEWMSAFADILIEHSGMSKVLENLPPSMSEWKAELSNATNPLADWLATRVTVTGVRSDFVLLSDLKEAFENDTSFRKPISVVPKAFVSLAKAFFSACKGATVPKTDTCKVKIDGLFISKRNVVFGVEKYRASTSSASELRFKAALELETSLVFESVYPDWLRNAVTKCPMQLDMYNEGKKLAVEYDGPQHYEFPNEYHKSEAEFVAQQDRDRQKDVACKERMITLVRVRASDLVVEMQSFKEQMDVLLPLWRSWCDGGVDSRSC